MKTTKILDNGRNKISKNLFFYTVSKILNMDIKATEKKSMSNDLIVYK